MSKPRLLFLSHTHQFLGGGEHSLIAIMRDCIGAGFDVHLIVPKHGEFQNKSKNIGASVHVIKSYWWVNNGNNEFHPVQNRQAIRQMRRVIQKVTPIFCITNTLVNPWLAYSAALEGVKHIWLIREFGDSDHELSFWASKKEICSMVSDLSNKVFVNSKALKKHYRPLINSELDVLYPPVKTPKVTNKVSPFNKDKLKLVLVGSISPGKGQLDAVKATKQLKAIGYNPRLLLVGPTANEQYKNKLEGYIEQNDLSSQVAFVGYTPNPANFVGYADVSLVCSRTEAFGRVTVESLLLSIPVIGTNTAGTKELLGSFSKELLYEPGDYKDLANKVVMLIDDKDMQLKIKSELAEQIRQTHNPNKANTPFIDYINSSTKKEAKQLADYRPLELLLNKQAGLPIRKRALSAARKIRARLFR